MVTQSQIQHARKVSILNLVSQFTTLKRIAATRGGEYAGPCPMCGGNDRFHYQAGRNLWFCRQCTGGPENGWKDSIELYMRLYNVPFSRAVEELANDCVSQVVVFSQQNERINLLPNPQWQLRGTQLVERGQDNLWGKPGRTATYWKIIDPTTGDVKNKFQSPLDWLYDRGLEEKTLRMRCIGYIPNSVYDKSILWGLEGKPMWISTGIIIPTYLEGILWGLKIRRPTGKPKYIHVRGSKPAMFQAETIREETSIACVTEGEFDAILVWQALQHAINPVWHDFGVITLGSNSNYPQSGQWKSYISSLELLLLLYDQDGKSQRVIDFWQKFNTRTRIVHWHNIRPHDKDLTDFHLSGGRLLDLISWAVTQERYRGHDE